jgi:long-chain acyl-CoA synthetase
MTGFTRVFDLLAYQAAKYPQAKALNERERTGWRSYSTEIIAARATSLAGWLLSLGLEKGDRVAFIPRGGHARWMALDFACQMTGAVVVPLHPTNSESEAAFIVNEVEARLCVAADAELYEKYRSAMPATLLGYFHWQSNQPGYLAAWDNQTPSPEVNTAVQSRTQAIRESDLLTILYTSGTSGEPKGTCLTHSNVVANIQSILPILPLQPGDRVLSFLPFSHVFERTSCYAYLAFGANVYFNSAREALPAEFAAVRPLLCTSVPRTLEKMYDYLEQQCLQKNQLKRRTIQWAMRVGQQFGKRPMNVWYLWQLFWARFWVLRTWRKALGGKMKYVVVGAAALRADIGRMFSAAGVQVLTGYGMTEAAPFISVNRCEPGLNKFGTVGLAIPGVEIRIDEPNESGEGEILVKGPNVMVGYYQRPELTAETLRDGWLHTGDTGRFVKKRFLEITGRKKEVFKTTSGIYISPQVLENHFTASPFILQCLVFGFNRPFVIALVVPHMGVLQSWCEENAIHWTAPQFMIHNIKVVQKMQQEIDHLNTALPGYQCIRKFVLVETEWTIEQGDMTTSFKLLRDKILSRYTKEIEKLYA